MPTSHASLGPLLNLCKVTHRPRQPARPGSRTKVSQSWAPPEPRELQGTFKGALGLLFTLNRPCLRKHYMSWDVLSELMALLLNLTKLEAKVQ